MTTKRGRRELNVRAGIEVAAARSGGRSSRRRAGRGQVGVEACHLPAGVPDLPPEVQKLPVEVRNLAPGVQNPDAGVGQVGAGALCVPFEVSNLDAGAGDIDAGALHFRRKVWNRGFEVRNYPVGQAPWVKGREPCDSGRTHAGSADARFCAPAVSGRPCWPCRRRGRSVGRSDPRDASEPAPSRLSSVSSEEGIVAEPAQRARLRAVHSSDAAARSAIGHRARLRQ